MSEDVRMLHERMGNVNYQPVNVKSFTNKRLTINFRTPLERLQQLVPPYMEVEEIGDTGQGMISQCVCDFHVTRLGWLPIPPTHTNEMLCRISVKIRKGDEIYRAYYTLRSDSSSWFLGILGGYFSHFRKAVSPFTRRDDGIVYELNCEAKDEICRGYFCADMASISKEKPATTAFEDVQAATDFVFQLDGSCGYSYRWDRLSFQKIEYPKWDISFCHRFEYRFALLDYLFSSYRLEPEFDSVLFMEKVPQVWGQSWLYPPQSV